LEKKDSFTNFAIDVGNEKEWSRHIESQFLDDGTGIIRFETDRLITFPWFPGP